MYLSVVRVWLRSVDRRSDQRRTNTYYTTLLYYRIIPENKDRTLSTLIDVLANLDVTRANEGCLALEVACVDRAQFSGVEYELCQVDFASVDRIQKGRAAGSQTLAMVRMVNLELGLH